MRKILLVVVHSAKQPSQITKQFATVGRTTASYHQQGWAQARTISLGPGGSTLLSRVIARLDAAGPRPCLAAPFKLEYVLSWYQLSTLGWFGRTASRAALDALASRTEYYPLLPVRVASA